MLICRYVGGIQCRWWLVGCDIGRLRTVLQLQDTIIGECGLCMGRSLYFHECGNILCVPYDCKVM